MPTPQTPRELVARFTVNLDGYFREYRIWLILLALAAVADTISTIMFMVTDGIDHEVHPGVRVMSLVLGPIAGPIASKMLQVLGVMAITIYFRQRAWIIFMPVVILYTWAAWYNIWGRNIYVPRLLDLLGQS